MTAQQDPGQPFVFDRGAVLTSAQDADAARRRAAEAMDRAMGKKEETA